MGTFSIWHWIIVLVIVGIPFSLIIKATGITKPEGRVARILDLFKTICIGMVWGFLALLADTLGGHVAAVMVSVLWLGAWFLYGMSKR